MSGLLTQRLPEDASGTERDFNAGRYYSIIVRTIKDVFEGEYKKPQQQTGTEDPLERFLLAHKEHRDMEKLIVALEAGGNAKADAVMGVMCSDDWSAYLKKVSLNDTRSIFAFLARAEGRKQSGFAPEDSGPLINERGEYVLSQKEEAGLLTGAVKDRLSAVATLWEDTKLSRIMSPPFRPEERPLGPFREQMIGSFKEVTRLEVTKAVGGLTSGKAPGPDGIPAEIFKQIAALLPVLQVLVNAIYSTGKIPEEMGRVHVVMLKKPGKDSRIATNRRPISLINSDGNHRRGDL